MVVPASAIAASTSIVVTQGSGGSIFNQALATGQSTAGSVTGGSYSGIADFGVLKTFASQSAPTTNNPGYGYYTDNLSVTASFTDVVTVSAPGGVTSGNFIGSINVDGLLTPQSSLSYSGNVGFAILEIAVKLPDLNQTVFSLAMTATDYSGAGGFLSGSLNGDRYTGPYTGPFDFAIPFETLVGQTIEVSLTCTARGINVGSGQTAGGTCAFDHSLYWGGVSGGVDQNGNAISQLNFMSGSGSTLASPRRFPNRHPGHC